MFSDGHPVLVYSIFVFLYGRYVLAAGACALVLGMLLGRLLEPRARYVGPLLVLAAAIFFAGKSTPILGGLYAAGAVAALLVLHWWSAPA